MPENEIVLHGGGGIVPQSMAEAMRMADLMASAKLVPVHLQKSPGDCLLVINQALRWGLDPVTVAQATCVVSGKLCYEGKLVAAVLVSTGAIRGRPDYTFAGEGDGRTITVSAMTNDGKVRTITGCVRDWKSNNRYWQSQPDDMLIYRGIRQWARRYAPEAMLGIVTPDEMIEEKEGKRTEPPPKTGRKPAEVEVVVEHPHPTPTPPPEVTLDAEEVGPLNSDEGETKYFLHAIAEAVDIAGLGDIKDAMQDMYGSDVPKELKDAWTLRKKALRPV